MKFIVGFSFIFILSCSQTVETKKYQRFDRVSYLEQGARPEFYFSHDNQKNNSNKRGPASVAAMSDTESEELTSLRALYFSSIWKQKKQMEKILSLKSDNYCPAFHQEVISMKNYTPEEFLSFEQMYSNLQTNKNPLVYPILALPYEGSDVYSYAEQNKLSVDDLKDAFENYYKITENEIDSLCETGVSDGYFMTKNLTDYYVNKESFNSSSRHLEAILKTPYVANLYVISSFKRNNTEVNISLLDNLNARWFIGYLDSLKEARNNRIVKNTQVK